MATGRFAPSPTGPLHLGNLRTALLAWLFARSAGSRFLVRMEDLDRVTCRAATTSARQLADLAALGLDWDGEVVRQSERFERYDAAIDRLTGAGLDLPLLLHPPRDRGGGRPRPTATSPEGAYPGTCRDLTAANGPSASASGRPPGARACAADGERRRVRRPARGPVDRRGRRRRAAAQRRRARLQPGRGRRRRRPGRRARWCGATTCSPSRPRQIHLADLLGLPVPAYAHVPLVLGPTAPAWPSATAPSPWPTVGTGPLTR